MIEKNKNFLIETNFSQTVLSKLSPLQKKIVVELSSGPLTLNELSEKTDSSIYTIGKQLSMLQCRTKCSCLKKKGINEPLVQKRKEEKLRTTYFLNLNGRIKS